MRHILRSVALAGSALLLLGCSGDDDSAEPEPSPPSGSTAASQPLTSAGDAVAAEGSELDEAPGPVDRTLLEGFDEVAIAITDADGTIRGWCVLLAETPDQRQRGLMEVEDLGGYPGMLFVWDADSSSSFYMRNTPTALSIAWFDADGALVSIADMAPCGDVPDCPLYPAEGSYRFALEVPQGELEGLGVTEGSSLRVGGACLPRSDSG